MQTNYFSYNFDIFQFVFLNILYRVFLCFLYIFTFFDKTHKNLHMWGKNVFPQQQRCL